MTWQKIPLGYGIRISGSNLKKFLEDHKIDFDQKVLSTSFDANLVPNYFKAGECEWDFQEQIPRQLWGKGQYLFEAFDLFSSDQDALSCLGGQAPHDISLYMYEAFIRKDYKYEPGKSYFKAIQDGSYRQPTLKFREIGFEVFDLNFTSITHSYCDKKILDDIPYTPEGIEKIEKENEMSGLFLIKIFQADKSWWLK